MVVNVSSNVQGTARTSPDAGVTCAFLRSHDYTLTDRFSAITRSSAAFAFLRDMLILAIGQSLPPRKR